ncbi:MAG: extracellular solute-binding protein [Pseudomonadota bacterium]
MTRVFRAAVFSLVTILLFGSVALATPQHAIAMYGEPALPPDFVSLPQANPNAPQGGGIVLGELGGFDSMNPYIRKGRAPRAVRAHTVETLMARNYDEPFTLYGLLAESIEVSQDRSWVEFTLHEEAEFSSGDPVTVEDVIWSFEILGTQGHLRYRTSWQNVASIAAVGDRTLRITFKEQDLEAPLIMGLRPVLRKADWDGREFDVSSLDVVTGSGPYVVEDFEPGRFINLRRNPDYWGNDLPFNRGLHNFETIRYEYFRDGAALFEAFKRGELSLYREPNAVTWEDSYDFPAIRDGRIVKATVPHQRPSGLRGFVMNTRKPLFDDWRVREAMIQLFNFDFISKTLTGGVDPRITSYFSKTVLAASSGPAEGMVAELLAPFGDHFRPGVMEGYSLPKGNAAGRDRRALRAALGLFEEAGWSIQSGVLSNGSGEPFKFEVLLKSDQTEEQAIWTLYADALKQAGIDADVTLVDDAQYTERMQTYDFDMTFSFRPASLSPGNEQTLYWGSESGAAPGSRNYPGVQSKAVDRMIEALLQAEDQAGFQAAAKALDRLLMAGRYVIPTWHTPYSRIAHSSEITYPDYIQVYGDWTGFLPDTWHLAE